MISTEAVDLGATGIAKYGDELVQSDNNTIETLGEAASTTKLGEVKQKTRKLRIASGETRGEAEMPTTCAPLIYPALDAAAAAEPVGSEGKDEGGKQGLGSSIKTTSKNAQKFVNNYFDRQAQADCVSPSQLLCLTTFSVA